MIHRAQSIPASRVSEAPRISIIIATSNAARTFERCIASITGQQFTDWELLVSDGSSTDATVDILRRHADQIAWWRSEPDGGIYDAWNQALAHARGDYVCFLGADDAWAANDSLALLFAAMGSVDYDLVTSRGLMFDPATGKKLRFGGKWDYRRLGRRMIVCHPGMLHRRALFQQHGGFDTRYRIAGDLEFLLRLPADTRTLHVDVTSVLVEASGISRRNVFPRLREQRLVLARCPRYGPFHAWCAWLDKLWRDPLARLFGLSH